MAIAQRGVLAVAGCAVIASLAPGLAHAQAQTRTTIASPRVDQVIGNGRVRVVLRARPQRASADGRDITRRLVRSDGAWRATLRVGSGLHYGTNELSVSRRGSDRAERRRFVVAQRTPGLLRLGDVEIGSGEAPVRVDARAAPGTRLQAFLNGQRVDYAFRPRGNRFLGRLGAFDGLHAGRNRLVVLVYRVHASRRSAAYQAEAVDFRLARGRFLASAGRDKITEQGSFVRLVGRTTRVATRASARSAQDDDGVTYHWAITSAPGGSQATLDDPASERPGLEPDVPGEYVIQLTATAPDGTTSNDTVTVTVRADVPPMGAALQTVADDRGTITYNGDPVPNTTLQSCNPAPDPRGCAGQGSWAVWNRQTLQLVTSGNGPMNPDGLKALADLADRYNAAPSYLMVVNLQGVPGNSADAQRLFRTLGVTAMSPDDLAKTLSMDGQAPVSIVGMPGSPAGSAFISNHFLACGCIAARSQANMSGYLRLNPVTTTGDFEFVFTDQLQFDTDASAAASRITMKVGDATFDQDVPTDGSSGFYVLQLDSKTLTRVVDGIYPTNRPGGAEDQDGAAALAANLAQATGPRSAHGERLVLLQAYGTPRGSSPVWVRVAEAIEELGGTRQVVLQLNNIGSDQQPGSGPYALVGRTGMIGPAPESSRPLTNRPSDGRLQGVMARARDAQHQALIADPVGGVNFDLIRIVNRPTPADGGFPKFTPGQAAAAGFLGRDPDVMGVCDRAAPTCDVRKAYYTRYAGTDWGNILTRLGNDATKAKCAAGGPGFTPEECDHARQQLELEIGRRNQVEAYFGPKGLQVPFLGGVQVAALVDIGKISEQIMGQFQRPPTGNATSDVLSIISYVVRIAAIAGPEVAPVVSGIGAAFALSAYLTRDDGSPDLVGPQVSRAAANLGSDLYERYQNASASFTTLSKIVMSDYSKLTEVAAATSQDAWRLGDVATSTESIRNGTRATIYQSLVPVAFPVLYDLGTGIGRATQWICRSHGALYDKRLFQNTPFGAQVTYSYTKAGPYEAHVVAVGAVKTMGTLHSAFIPAPPDNITGQLFGSPTSPQGGVGLNKLQFYSPRYFRLFEPVLQQYEEDLPFGFQTCQSMPDPPGNSG